MHATAITFLAAAGDLTGNWSWTVWLLIPLVLLLALVTALVLGSADEPTRSARSSGGVSRYLDRNTTTDQEEVR